jgi:ribosomal protein RSM22 (predicted rRNA methylase)
MPRTLLDFGAGAGSATLAARDIWPDSLTDACVLVDPSRSMGQVRRRRRMWV